MAVSLFIPLTSLSSSYPLVLVRVFYKSLSLATTKAALQFPHSNCQRSVQIWPLVFLPYVSFWCLSYGCCVYPVVFHTQYIYKHTLRLFFDWPTFVKRLMLEILLGHLVFKLFFDSVISEWTKLVPITLCMFCHFPNLICTWVVPKVRRQSPPYIFQWNLRA